MPTIRFIEHDGTVHDIEAHAGRSLMLAAVENLVPGIDADCGGECACATCHVMLGEDWFERLPAARETEDQMLSLNPERAPTSRLSCQIRVTDAMEGMAVRLPEFQF